MFFLSLHLAPPSEISSQPQSIPKGTLFININSTTGRKKNPTVTNHQPGDTTRLPHVTRQSTYIVRPTSIFTGQRRICIVKIKGRCLRAEWRPETYHRHEIKVYEIAHRKQTANYCKYVYKPNNKQTRVKPCDTINRPMRCIRGSLCLSLATSYVHHPQDTTTTRQHQQLTHHITPQNNADSSGDGDIGVPLVPHSHWKNTAAAGAIVIIKLVTAHA